MEVKAGYKQTEVSVIPEDWEVKNLSEITGLDVGYAFKSSWFKKDDGIPLLRGENVGYGRLDWTDTRRLPEKQAMSFGSYLLQPDDVVIGMDRTFTKSGSKISRVREIDCPCLLVQRVGKFVPRKCSPKFLWALLSSEKIQAAFQLEQKGMDIPHLSRTEILSPLIAFPPTKAEQEAIAEALSDADALIEALEGLIAKKRQVKQGVMQELLTGKKRLSGFEKKHGYRQTEVGVIPEDWQVMALARVSKMKSGESITGDIIDQFSEYPCYGGNGLRGFTNRFTHDGKYALIGRQGALCGNVLGVSGKFFASEHAVVVTPFEQTDIQWLTYVLEDMNLNQYSESSAQPGLSVAKILNLVLAVPPTKAEQTAIAEILSDMDAEIAALEAKLSKAREVKAGMMSVLLSGMVRLV